jgi:hypothetical protein
MQALLETHTLSKHERANCLGHEEFDACVRHAGLGHRSCLFWCLWSRDHGRMLGVVEAKWVLDWGLLAACASMDELARGRYLLRTRRRNNRPKA